MSSQKLHKERKFFKYMKRPAKFLARARDFYVQSFTSCAGSFAYGGGAVGGPNLQFASLPRSFSANSSYSREEDLRELIRAASTNHSLYGSPVEGGGAAVVRRSRTVAICRIDEERACEFGNDVVELRPAVLPRSKSYAPSTRIGMV